MEAMGTSPQGRRALLGAMFAVLACLFPAAAAASGTASVSGSTLTYNGGSEQNFITFTVPVGGTIRLTEGNSGTSIVPGVGCATVTSVIVDCNSAGVTLIVANGNAGNDSLDNQTTTTADLNGGDDFDQLISTSPTNDTLDGGNGVFTGATDTGDYADYEIATAGVTASLTSATGASIGTDTIVNVESLEGSPFADTLTGDTNDNQLIGNGGDDTLSSGAGNDNLQGGTGKDSYNTGPGTDSIQDNIASGDADSVSYATEGGSISSSPFSPPPGFSSALQVFKPDGTDSLYDVPNIVGTSFGDSLAGDGNANIFDGSGGNDTLQGGGGGDTLTGGAGTDTVSYGNVAGPVNASLQLGSGTFAGTDTYSGIENVTGSPGNDTIEGNTGANTLAGGGGTDTLTFANAPAGVTVTYTGATGTTSGGGAGTDTLSGFTNFAGSAFADTFNFRNSVVNTIGCGGGADLIQADSTDTVGADCETIAPEAATAPTIDSGGVNQEGATFSATQGGWGGSLPTAYAYQWLSCNSAGSSCSSISGATSSIYTATSSDAGHTIRARVTASNAAGSDVSTSAASGVIQAASAPPATSSSTPPPDPVATPAASPTPVFTQSADAEPVSGLVLVKVPGSSVFVPLTQPELVPFGSIIDARKGRVRLRTVDTHGKIQTADFFGGIFQLFQQKAAGGITELDLYGGDFSVCPSIASTGKSKKADLARTKVKSSKTIRQLWSSGHGLFRTKGRYSSATIRGTTWLTADRCDGTLTRVTQGKVAVRDFVKNKTLTVKAPKRYLATPKR
jgi:Ca2+-binding RTX toxin-like protein